MRPTTRALTCAASAAVLVFGVTACDDDSSQKRESKARQGSYDKLTERQPAGTMAYSPSRATINQWVKKWGKPGKLSYVYIQNGKGEYGYFVLKGLPVSYCAMLTPTYELKGQGGSTSVPAPGVDGVYYSGNQCSSYYGIDATTGAYLEWSIGANQSYFLYDEPMDLPQFKDAEPMGPSSLKDVENKNKKK